MIADPKAHVFTVLIIATFLSSTIFLSFSLTWNDNFYAGIPQVIFFIMQACCSISSMVEQSRTGQATRLPLHFCICICFGAMCSIVSAVIYPYRNDWSTLFSFLAAASQATSTIVISNNSSGRADKDKEVKVGEMRELTVQEFRDDERS
jgi:hypothetical protein